MNNSHYQFINVDSGKCMDTPWGSIDDWAQMFIYTCSDAADSMDWAFRDLGDGLYNIINRKSGKCLDIEGGITEDWTPIIQYSCHSGESMKWRLEPIINIPEPITYESFDIGPLTMYPYVGRNIALLVPTTDFDPDSLNRIINAIDNAYDFYEQTTGREPRVREDYQYNGLATVAVVSATCVEHGGGAGCGSVGATGIELKSTTFDSLYSGVQQDNQFDQAVFYELGRNFWFYGNQINYKPPLKDDATVTGYAVFMRFMSMEAVGVDGGPFTDDLLFEDFRREVEGMLDLYLANSSLNWENTLKINQAPANPYGFGSSDLFASFLFELRRRYGDGFVSRIWKEVNDRPNAQTTQEAVDNFIIAASVAANENLTSLFTNAWRWPMSDAARAEVEELFLAPEPFSEPDELSDLLFLPLVRQ